MISTGRKLGREKLDIFGVFHAMHNKASGWTGVLMTKGRAVSSLERNIGEVIVPSANAVCFCLTLVFR